MTIELDGRLMTDRAATHAYLKEQFSFPDCYGKNLDALYDLLTEIGSPVTITVLHRDAIVTNLGAYGTSLLKTLQDASEKHPLLSLVYI